LNRRQFVRYVASSSLLALAGAPDLGFAEPVGVNCRLASTAPFEGGRLVKNISFLGLETLPTNRLMGEGPDARLYSDLSVISEQDPITHTSHFYVVRTIPADLPDLHRPWKIKVDGLVQTPLTIAEADLIKRKQPQGLHLLECSGNARPMGFRLLSTARWEGVPLFDVLAPAGRLPKATQVRISGLETDAAGVPLPSTIPGASWTFKLEDLQASGAFLATHMNGVPLPVEHGKPVRLMAPGWLGCCNIKWVNEITFVDDTAEPSAHMISYAPLTLQRGTPKFTKEYEPARMDTAAMPIRVEEWQVGGRPHYRVVGLIWGGSKPARQLVIRFGHRGGYRPVDCYRAPKDTTSWAFWYHEFVPPRAGVYHVQLRVADADLECRRLNADHYGLDFYINQV
jgi:DMSO/TMAO reductase YedYZ molybdopterin-dependent catalytic subunit